jgi:hypothetical protein
MTPWRRLPPDDPSRDRAHLAAVALLALLALLAAVVLAGAGCAAPVTCPLGTYPRSYDTDRSTEVGGTAKGDLPSQSVTAGATVRSTGSSDGKCAPLCRPGQLLQASEDGKTRSVRCLPERCPDGGVK